MVCYSFREIAWYGNRSLKMPEPTNGYDPVPVQSTYYHLNLFLSLRFTLNLSSHFLRFPRDLLQFL